MSSNVFDIAEKEYGSKSSGLSQSPFDIAEKSFKQTAFPEDDENDIQRDIERNQAQFTSRIGESALGLPGDLTNFVGGLFGFDPNMPGSEKFKEYSESLSQGYTKPQNEFEENVGD